MVVVVPLLVGITFLNAWITHLCLALFKGTSKSYEATYRVTCYAYSTWIFALVPCAGGVISSIWWLVATIIGLSKVHRTEGWRAALAVFLPVLVCMGAVGSLLLPLPESLGHSIMQQTLSRKLGLYFRPLAPKETDLEFLFLTVSTGLAASCYLYLQLGMPWPGCWFRRLTGIPCPTCGATRCAISLTQGT